MPPPVKRAVWAAVLSLAVGGIDVALQRVGITHQDTPTGSVAGFLFGAVLSAVLLILIANRHGWARWVFIALTGLTVLISFPVFGQELHTDPVGAVSTAIQAVLQVAAIVFLMDGNAVRWFDVRQR